MKKLEMLDNGRTACHNLRKRKEPFYMCTLAAAYAECGDYEEAFRWPKKALAVCGSSYKEDAATVRSELELFQKGKPYRGE